MYSKEEVRALKLEFWETFGSLSTKKRNGLGLPKQWTLHKTGIKPMSLKFEATKRFALVSLEISTKDEDSRLKLYEKLSSLSTIINSEFEGGVVWELIHETEEGREMSRIYYKLDNVNMFDKNDWPKMFEFLFNNMLKLETLFIDYRDYIKSDQNE